MLKHYSFLNRFTNNFMETTDINNTIIDGYLKLLKNLNLSNKLDLIARISLSLKTELPDNNKSFYDSFGAWDSELSSGEIITEIMNNRNFNRNIELF